MRSGQNITLPGEVHHNHFQRNLYLVSIFLSIFSAAFWCFFNFLTAEDAVVLFNRYNFLEGAPTFFYYAGYTSFFPQSMAFAFSALNPAIQAVLYSAVALSVFLFLLREVFLATKSGLTTLVLVVISAVFQPFIIYNLTFSFWTGLSVLGLVGLRVNVQRDALSLRDIFICLPGLAGSPLAIVFFPLFAWASLTTRSVRVLTVCGGTVISFIALVEHGGARADEQGLLSGLFANIISVLRQPMQYLISFANPGDLAMSVLGAFGFPVVIATAVWVVRRRKADGLPVALYSLGSVFAVIAALSASSVPLAGRYWFPIVVCALTLIGHFWTSPASNLARRWSEVILSIILCAVLFTSFFLRFSKWGGADTGFEEWQKLANPPPNMTAVVRDWHGDGGLWAIGTGQGTIPYEDCAGLWEHPSSFERYGFRIYCGKGVFR